MGSNEPLLFPRHTQLSGTILDVSSEWTFERSKTQKGNLDPWEGFFRFRVLFFPTHLVRGRTLLNIMASKSIPRSRDNQCKEIYRKINRQMKKKRGFDLQHIWLARDPTHCTRPQRNEPIPGSRDLFYAYLIHHTSWDAGQVTKKKGV